MVTLCGQFGVSTGLQKTDFGHPCLHISLCTSLLLPVTHGVRPVNTHYSAQVIMKKRQIFENLGSNIAVSE